MAKYTKEDIDNAVDWIAKNILDIALKNGSNVTQEEVKNAVNSLISKSLVLPSDKADTFVKINANK